MQRVLENLIRNALKYTPNGGDVSISLERKPEFLSVAVADTGCGIAEEDLGRVFDRFYRSGPDPNEDPHSAGLGLAIVRRILDLHGSRITVSSQPGKGTRFEFEIPARAPTASGPIPRTGTSAASRSPAMRSSSPPPRRRPCLQVRTRLAR